MHGSIDIPFPIGAVVWRATTEARERWEKCPTCCGSTRATVTYGNGQQYDVPCPGCEVHYEDRGRGTVMVPDHVIKPESFVCTRVVRIDDSGVWYSESPAGATAYQSCVATELFADKAACVARCDALVREREENLRHLAIRELARKAKDRVGSVRYWLGVVSKLEAEIERARARCMERRTETAVEDR